MNHWKQRQTNETGLYRNEVKSKNWPLGQDNLKSVLWLLATNDSTSKTFEYSEVVFDGPICGRSWDMKVWRKPWNLRHLQQLAYKEGARIPADRYRRLTESDFPLLTFSKVVFINNLSVSSYFQKGSNNCVHLFSHTEFNNLIKL